MQRTTTNSFQKFVGRLAASLAVVSMTLVALLTSSAMATPSPNLGSCIYPGQYIRSGQYLQSYPNYYKLTMQSDGNLVLYTSGGAPLWDSQTSGNAGAYAVFQTDGNFVVYSASGQPLWYAASNNSAPGDLCMQSDANLVIYSASGSALWATMTGLSATVGQELSYNPGASGQCTWWAENEFHNYVVGGPYIDTLATAGTNGNAMYWATNASRRGWNVGSTPRIGSIVVFQPGVAGAGSVGHVAWVTQVYPARNAITVSEMDFPNSGQVDTRTISPAFGVNGQQYIYVNP